MRMSGTSCGRQVNHCMLACRVRVRVRASGAKRTVAARLRCAAPIQTHPKGTCTAGRPLCLACIGGASANWGGARGEEMGGSRLRAGPGGGTAHAPVN